MAEEEKAAPGDLVGARLAYHVDYSGTGSTHLSGEAVGDDLEFLNAILGKIRQGAAHNFVVVIGAVHCDVATSAKCSGGRHFKSVRLGRVIVRCWPVSRK